MKDLSAYRIESGYWYLASPYSKYPAGIDSAFEDICKIAAKLIGAGVPVYAPIAHMHPIAIAGLLDPLDHKIWLPVDKPMMEAAHGMIVCRMPSWESSYGIQEEIKIFSAAGKPIGYLDPGDLC